MSTKPIALLEAKHICMQSRLGQFGQAPVVKDLVHDVSFSLYEGRVLGIVGESGSGKSLTAKALMGIYAAGIHLTQGEVSLQGEALPIHDTKAMEQVRGKVISMLFQDPLSSFNPLHRVGKQITEALTQHRPCTPTLAKSKAHDLLQSLGIEDVKRIMEAFPHQLSGGQRQRAMLAMSLMAEPQILIADEPTTALDAAIQLQVVELLRSIKHKVALIIISHDLGMMRRIADDICVMQQGRVVEYGPAQELFSAPKHAYSKMLLDRAQDAQPAALQDKAKEILHVQNLQVHYPLRKAWFWQKQAFHTAVNNASFTLKQQECLGIVGESGSGKTSLGLAIARLIQSQGDIIFSGKNLQGLPPKELRSTRKKLQMVFQDPLAALNPRLSVYQCIAEGIRETQDLSEKAVQDKVAAALESVELSPQIQHRYPHEFSGGQCQRICIARALVMEPNCIVFDEPTSSLDRNTQFQIIKLIKNIQEKMGLSCIFITHDLSLVRALCHNILVMQQGNIVEYATNTQLFTAPQSSYTKLLIEAADVL